MNQERIRAALAEHLGHELTPERAVQIENDLLRMTLQLAEQRTAITVAPTPTMAQILELERQILSGPQAETPTTHHFAPGLYARQMIIPAGTVLTGAVHKTEHLAIFVGDITVWTEGGMKRLTGHHTIVSKPGAKRVGYAHADTWCTGFFPTDETDISKLEAMLCETPELLLCNRTPEPLLEE
jgi:hypothetical protein